jgi:hypothetical protein
MKTTYILIVTGLAALAAGCNNSNPTIEGSPGGGTNLSSFQQKCEDAREMANHTWQQAQVNPATTYAEAKESAETSVDYAFNQKRECVAQAVAELDSLDQKIRQLLDKVATASDFVKIDARTKILRLTDQRAALNQELAALQNATAENWRDAKTEFKKAKDEAKTSWQQTWEWLRQCQIITFTSWTELNEREWGESDSSTRHEICAAPGL